MPWVEVIWIQSAIGELVQNRINVEPRKGGIEQFGLLLSVACGAMSGVAVLDLILGDGISDQSTWSQVGIVSVRFDEDWTVKYARNHTTIVGKGNFNLLMGPTLLYRLLKICTLHEEADFCA